MAGGVKFWETDQNWAQIQVFCHFLKFGPLAFTLIDQDDILEQYLPNSRYNTKNIGGRGEILGKRAKIGPKISFFAIFSSLVHYISFKLHRMIAQNNVQLIVEVKLTRKILKDANLGQEDQNWDQNQVFFPFSQVWFISFPLNCT